jgi:hypothetical protein
LWKNAFLFVLGVYGMWFGSLLPAKAESDGSAPVLYSIKAIDTTADVRRFSSWLDCTPESCGTGVVCDDLKCSAQAKIEIAVQDLPVIVDQDPQTASGIKQVSVRFASPTAARLKMESDYAMDENVQKTFFKVAALNFPLDMKVGVGNTETKISMPVKFDGYAEPGKWQLDSVVLSDHKGNINTFDKQALSKFSFAIQVISLELASCTGKCNKADATCRQFGNAEPMVLPRPQSMWWRCTTSRPLPSHAGVCCMGNACVRTSAASLPIQATCPFEAMKLAACGCAESTVGESWVCTSQTSASSAAGTARKCGVGTDASCARGNSTDTAEYCSPAGRQQLFYDESRPPPGRYSVYLLYWYKSTNTDVLSSQNPRQPLLPLQAAGKMAAGLYLQLLQPLMRLAAFFMWSRWLCHYR